MAYTLPSASNADASWVGAGAYTVPSYNAADATWSAPAPAGVTGTAEGALHFTGAAVAAHGVAGAGSGTLGFSGSGSASFGILSITGTGEGALEFSGSGAASHGVSGEGAGTIEFSGAGVAARGVTCAGDGALDFTGTGVAQVLRYEVRGEVRLDGMLVNRRVRCYKRATGDLVGQVDTVAGLYRVPAGFDDGEVYTMAIHLDEAATDWIPPAANRLVPVLAEDAA